MNSDLTKPRKKQYAPPRLNKLTSEKAKTFLDEVAQGDQKAKDDLLNLLGQTSG